MDSFRKETERYRYCLRCNPVRGDHQAYLTVFNLWAQERENYDTG